MLNATGGAYIPAMKKAFKWTKISLSTAKLQKNVL